MTLLQHQLHLMGTVIDLTIEAEQAELLMQNAIALLHTYNQRFSANDAQSELSQINQQAGDTPVVVNKELFKLIAIGKQHSCDPFSNLNIAIGPLVQTWRIGFSDAKLPSQEAIQQKLALTDPQDILLDTSTRSVFLKKKGMAIDLGSLAKGYIADNIIQYFKENGASTAMINLGGNFLAYGPNPQRTNGLWHVGIQHPYKERGHFLTITPVRNCSVVTSGVYERTLTINNQTYHHILDKTTGYPIATTMQSITIYAKSSLDCEIWSTKLFGLPIEQVLDTVNRLKGIECLIITNTLELLSSNGIR